jgi:hypothetical protein
MERIIELLNKINRQGKNQMFYSVYPNTNTINIQAFEGKAGADFKANQSLTLYYDKTFTYITFSVLDIFKDVIVNQKLDNMELYKLLESYEEK